MGTVLPNVTVELTRYRQAVSDAIKKLKEYYFVRENKNDVTSGVLSY